MASESEGTMGEDVGSNNEQSLIETLSKTCKEASKDWPIEISWVTLEVPFRKESGGPYLIVKVDRKRPLPNQEKLLLALGKGGTKVVLMDDAGYYAPFSEAALRIIQEHCKRKKPMLVWRSPAAKAAMRASARGRRLGT